MSPLNFAHSLHISFNMFRGLIDGRLERVLEGFDEGLVTEVRLRVEVHKCTLFTHKFKEIGCVHRL